MEPCLEREAMSTEMNKRDMTKPILACVLAALCVYAMLMLTIRIHVQSKDRLVRVPAIVEAGK